MPDGTSSYYINERFLSGILEKSGELHEAIATPSSTAEQRERVSSFRPEALLLSSGRPGADEPSWVVSPWQATQLWGIYRLNVDPVLKVLHLPTAEPLFYAALHGNGPEDHIALLFAVYFAAVTTLSPSDTKNLLGRDKAFATTCFQANIQQALFGSSFLDSPTISGLQALSIYIVRQTL
jgi:hypothetical protein